MFKAQVALDAIRGEKKLAGLVKVHDAHPNQITDWKCQLLKNAVDVFCPETAEPTVDLEERRARIGRQPLETSRVGLASA